MMDPGEITMTLWFHAVLGILAWAAHFMSKWQGYQEKNGRSGLIRYLRAIPGQTATSIICAMLAFLLCWAEGWLNPITALACGYMPNSIIDNAIERAKGMTTARQAPTGGGPTGG